jgi:hypothetical protein
LWQFAHKKTRWRVFVARGIVTRSQKLQRDMPRDKSELEAKQNPIFTSMDAVL